MSGQGNLPMHEMLLAIAWAQQLLDAGHHPAVIEAKAEKASRKDYIDYGSSIRSAWLTDKGRKFLEETAMSATRWS